MVTMLEPDEIAVRDHLRRKSDQPEDAR